MPNGAELFAQAAARLGLDTIFTLVGDHLNEALAADHTDSLIFENWGVYVWSQNRGLRLFYLKKERISIIRAAHENDPAASDYAAHTYDFAGDVQDLVTR